MTDAERLEQIRSRMKDWPEPETEWLLGRVESLQRENEDMHASALARIEELENDRPLLAGAKRLAIALARVEELEQALWDVYGILGFDQDGQPKAGGHGDYAALLRSCAEEFRQDYDIALEEQEQLDARIDELERDLALARSQIGGSLLRSSRACACEE